MMAKNRSTETRMTYLPDMGLVKPNPEAPTNEMLVKKLTSTAFLRESNYCGSFFI
jgi:hypothetical protein